MGYAFFFLYIPNSEGYMAAVSAVRALPDVRSRVGEVREVGRSPFGLFREQFAGSQRRVVLSLNVRGDRGKSTIRIWMIKRDHEWTVDQMEFLDP
jgi:hypothetical protein